MDLTPVTLEGEAVRLEPLSLDHLDTLLEAGADPGIWRYMPSDSTSRDGMLAFIDEALGLPACTDSASVRNSGPQIRTSHWQYPIRQHRSGA